LYLLLNAFHANQAVSEPHYLKGQSREKGHGVMNWEVSVGLI
jgi:hypothetical protein